MQLLSDEIDRFIAAPVGADELAARKAMLIGGFSRSVETTAGLAGDLRGLIVTGRAPADLTTRIEALQAVSAADVQRYAAAHLGRANRQIAVAGDAKLFAEALARARPALVKVPLAELERDGP